MSSLPATQPCGPAIILVRPKYAENIGASARIAHNFGFKKLIIVTEKEHDKERMLKMATHKAAHIINTMEVVPTTPEATAPYHCIVGTTARQGRHRPEEMTPRAVMQNVAHYHSSSIALMFGPEDTGLANEDVNLCQFTSTIPTDGFSSLNLAQAVAIHCYEFYTATGKEPDTVAVTQEFANSFDLEGMYEHIEEALHEVTFLHDTNRIYWMRSLRQFFNRLRLKKKEASMIRGICRKFLWHSKKNPQNSLES